MLESRTINRAVAMGYVGVTLGFLAGLVQVARMPAPPPAKYAVVVYSPAYLSPRTPPVKGTGHGHQNKTK